MDVFDEISEKFNILVDKKAQLETEYIDKQKGDLYMEKASQLISQMDALKKKALNLGKGTSIIHFKGTLVRPHRKNSNIKVQVPFSLYLTGLTDVEAIKVLKLRFKNIQNYEMKQYISGIIYE